jgi:hypothetical protein
MNGMLGLGYGFPTYADSARGLARGSLKLGRNTESAHPCAELQAGIEDGIDPSGATSSNGNALALCTAARTTMDI